MAIWLRARREAGARSAATVVLVLLIGLVGSVTIAAAIGARRTATAPRRLLAALDGRVDMHILDLGSIDLAAITSLPMVERASVTRFIVADGDIEVTVTSDQILGSQLAAGTIPAEDPLAAVIDGAAARQKHLSVGDTVDLAFYTPSQWEAQDPSGGPQGPHPTVHITGIIRQPDDVDASDPNSESSLGSESTLSLPQTFYDQHGKDTAFFTDVFVSVELRHGSSDAAAFKEAVRRMPGGNTLQLLDVDATQNQVATGRTVRLQAFGLLLVAVVSLLAAFTTVGQLLVRHLRADSVETPTLAALGMTRWQLVHIGMLRGLGLGVVSALLSVLGAVAWSQLTPVGLARQVEPHPGREVNVALLAAGALVVVMIVIATAAIAAARAARPNRTARTGQR
ncbi:MAG: FtsX-like permease family protein, partial [Ilumatobacteraceae bacterium]